MLESFIASLYRNLFLTKIESSSCLERPELTLMM